ncbi:MAG: hypothetical protein IIZ78_15330 [Clostridiales bacterium]|nr:hypothetical protein [Clostridiales bacterium]
MAGFIKGITIEFGADTTKLNGALKKTQGTINKTQAELKQINRALKFNPGNTVLLKQKFELLQRSVKETREKLKQLTDMQRQMDASGVDKSSAQYRELEREIEKTKSQLKSAEGELKKFGSVGKQQALAVGNAMKMAGGKIKSAGRTITTTVSVWGMAAIYSGGKLIDMAEKQAQAENKLTEIYKARMGVGKQAVKSTLELAAAEQQLGVVGDEVQIAAAQQLATYANYPNTVNTILPALNDLLVQQKGLNGTQEDAVGLANLFGKAMMGQTGALKRAGISFTEAQEQVLKYGTEEEKAAMLAEVVNQNVGDMNEKFAQTDAGKIQQAKNALGDMGEEIGAILLPVVADLVSWFQDNLLPKIQAFIDFMKEHPQIATFAVALAGIVAVAGPLLMFIGSLIGMLGSLVTITTALDVAMAPIIAVILAIVAAIAAAIAIGVLLYKNWDKIKAKAIEIKTKISETWTNIKKSILNTVKPIVQKTVASFQQLKAKVSSIFNAVKNAITHPIETAKNILKRVVDKIKGFFRFKVPKPHVPIPHFSIKPAGWKLSDLLKGKIPSLGIKWYAQGGIFDSPTIAGIGEAGPEAVVPLNKLWDKLDNIANAGGNPIVVNVYGSDNMSVSELATAVEQKLIQTQRRRSAAWA